MFELISSPRVAALLIAAFAAIAVLCFCAWWLARPRRRQKSRPKVVPKQAILLVSRRLGLLAAPAHPARSSRGPVKAVPIAGSTVQQMDKW